MLINIRTRARAMGMSLDDLATKAGLTRPYLYKLLNGGTKDPGINTLHRLAIALEMPPVALYREFVSNKFEAKLQDMATYAQHPCGGVNEEDAIMFVADVTVPDHSIVLPGERFMKTWAVQNVGRIPWVGRHLVRADKELVVAQRLPSGALQELMDIYLHSRQQSIAVAQTMPGQMVELSVEFTAPRENASVASVWLFQNANDQLIYGKDFILQAVVTVVGE